MSHGDLAIPIIQQGLRDIDWEIVEESADALEKLGWFPQDITEQIQYLIAKDNFNEIIQLGAKAVPVLLQKLQDPHPSVRRNVAWTLGEIGNLQAIKPLTHALQDKDPDVQWEAEASLEKIQTQND